MQVTPKALHYKKNGKKIFGRKFSFGEFFLIYTKAVYKEIFR